LACEAWGALLAQGDARSQLTDCPSFADEQPDNRIAATEALIIKD